MWINTADLLHANIRESVDDIGLSDHLIKPVFDGGVVRPPHFGSPVAEGKTNKQRERETIIGSVRLFLLTMLQSHNLLNHSPTSHFLFFGQAGTASVSPSINTRSSGFSWRRRNAAMRRLKINESEIAYNWSHGSFSMDKMPEPSIYCGGNAALHCTMSWPIATVVEFTLIRRFRILPFFEL